MASGIPEITDSNQPHNSGDLEHIRADMCELLRIWTRFERLLDEFEPQLAQFRTPLATMLTARRARRNNGRE